MIEGMKFFVGAVLAILRNSDTYGAIVLESSDPLGRETVRETSGRAAALPRLQAWSEFFF